MHMPVKFKYILFDSHDVNTNYMLERALKSIINVQINIYALLVFWGFPGVTVVRNPPANVGDMRHKRVRCLGWKDPLEEEIATCSSILA